MAVRMNETTRKRRVFKTVNDDKLQMTSTVAMETVHEEPFQLIQWTEDILMPGIFPDIQSLLPQISELEHRNGDVLLCSYPKSGTHWMIAMIRAIKVREVKEDQVDTFLNERLGLLESAGDLQRAILANSPRLLTTHLRPTRIPAYLKEGKAKIILVLRNPKDVAVSYYYHLKKAGIIRNKQDWGEFFISFQSGICPCGQYLDYIKAWDSMLKENKNLDIEIFYYEDLKTHGLEQIKRLAKHLGHNLNDAEIQQVLDDCSMKSLEERDNKALESSDEARKTPLTDEYGKTLIYRKGEIGDWKNHFTVAQNEMYDQFLKESMEGSMFRFRYM